MNYESTDVAVSQMWCVCVCESNACYTFSIKSLPFYRFSDPNEPRIKKDYFGHLLILQHSNETSGLLCMPILKRRATPLCRFVFVFRKALLV